MNLEDKHDALYELEKLTRDLVEAIDCGGCSDKESDFDANVRDALAVAEEITKGLKALERKGKKR